MPKQLSGIDDEKKGNKIVVFYPSTPCDSQSPETSVVFDLSSGSSVGGVCESCEASVLIERTSDSYAAPAEADFVGKIIGCPERKKKFQILKILIP